MFFPGGGLRQLLGPNNGAPVAGGGGYGGYGGYGGGGMPSWQELQRKLDEANAANENRYMQLLTGSDAAKAEELGGLRTGYNEMLGLAGKGADAQRMQEQQNLKHAEGAAQADATSRGLGNTTILSSLRRGAENESAIRTQGINDAQDRNKLSVAQNYYQNCWRRRRARTTAKWASSRTAPTRARTWGCTTSSSASRAQWAAVSTAAAIRWFAAADTAAAGRRKSADRYSVRPATARPSAAGAATTPTPAFRGRRSSSGARCRGNVGGMPFTYQV
jgi:hypothetical protein